MKPFFSLIIFIAFLSGSDIATPEFVDKNDSVEVFNNPLLPSGADPWSIYKDGFYYYTHTTGNRLEIWKTAKITDLKNAERKVIWRPPANTSYSKEIWAPELHYLRGKWYMYFAADNGDNNNHRMYVVENSSDDPMKGEWVFKGKVADKTDKWAIDGSVFEFKKQLYMLETLNQS
ncbi:MAG: glycosyl hydrolase family 43, partial [Pedobacter sp.]